MASYKKLDSYDSYFFVGGGGGEVRGVPISSSLEDNVESAILFTQGFSAPPTGREKPWERG